MNNHCEYIHGIFNSIKKIKFPFDKSEIPFNGIYILFENGELAHSTNRIVRVGTHTGDNNLPNRLKEHFMKENKDRSIFRKKIGEAVLNKSHDPFLDLWKLDLTTREAKEKYMKKIDKEKQKNVENEVTKYIQNNFSFIIINIDDKNIRLSLESKIISTVSLCNECKPSKKWLGNYSPEKKIKKSGLWLVKGLWKTPLDENEIKYLESKIC